MAYAAQVRVDDDIVVGIWRGAGTIPGDTDIHYFFAITEEQYLTVSESGLFYASNQAYPMYQIVDDELVTLEDTRNQIAFYENGTTTPITLVEMEVGDTVVVDVVKLDGEDVDTDFNDSITLKVSDGRWVKLSFTEGKATLTITASNSCDWSIFSQGNANIRDGFLKCRVYVASTL